MIGILIPVHNEEALLPECLKAAMIAASHPGLLGEEVQILVVLDSCTDRSSAIAQAFGVHSLNVEARNVGQVRGIGARHLLNQGARWISCTDADSRVASDWLVAQLALGVDAVCGTVTVDAWSEGFDESAQIRYNQAYRACDGHRHIHGANLGVSAGAYVRAGGFEPWPVMKMCNWCANWSDAAQPLPGAMRPRSSPVRGWTAAHRAVLAII